MDAEGEWVSEWIGQLGSHGHILKECSAPCDDFDGSLLRVGQLQCHIGQKARPRPSPEEEGGDHDSDAQSESHGLPSNQLAWISLLSTS